MQNADIIERFLSILNTHSKIVIAHVRHEYALSIQNDTIEYRHRQTSPRSLESRYTLYRFDIPSNTFYINHQPSRLDFNQKFLPILKTALHDLKAKKSVILTEARPC